MNGAARRIGAATIAAGLAAATRFAMAAPPIEVGPASDGSAAEVVLSQLGSEERQRLQIDGLIVREPAFREGMTFGALIVVDHDARSTFSVLAQPSRQSCYLPEVKKSTTIQRENNEEIVEFEVQKFGTSRYRVRHVYSPSDMKIDWALDPTFHNDLVALRGYFKVRPMSFGRALVEYGTAVDARKLLPNFIQRRAMRTDIPAALGRLRRYLQGGGKCPER